MTHNPNCRCIPCHAKRQKAKRKVLRADSGRVPGETPDDIDMKNFWDKVHERSRLADLERMTRR